MNPLFLGGLACAVLGIVAAVLIDGNSLGVLVGPSSFVLVVLGAVGAGLAAYGVGDAKRAPSALLLAVRGSAPDPDAAVTALGAFADTARREGMLALEGRLAEVDHAFLRKGLQLVVDGLDAAKVQEVLEIDIAALDERHQTIIGLFKSLGAYAPTFGMIGTVIGLINMLGNLSDPSQLGLGMSLALLTTLYGVLFANLVFLPIGTRLERLNAAELATLDLILDGVIELQAGASPRLLVERLETYLPAQQRVGHAERAAAAAAAASVEAA